MSVLPEEKNKSKKKVNPMINKNNKPKDYNRMFRTVIMEYAKKAPTLSSPEDRYAALVECIDDVFVTENMYRMPGDRYKIPSPPTPAYIAAMLRISENISNISFTDTIEEEDTALGIYVESGEKKGLYSISKPYIKQVISRYIPFAKDKDIDEVYNTLVTTCETRTLNKEVNLIPVANGLFDYESKVLIPFTPEKVFTAKSSTRFIPSAQNPIIQQPDGTTWDIHSWLNELFDGDMEIVNLIFQCLGAAMRPHQVWRKALFMYSRGGASGKGCILSLVQALCGVESCASIPMNEMDDRFGLSPILDKSPTVIIGDENDCGTYINSAGKFKSLCTSERLSIERKFKGKVSVKPTLFIMQAFNDRPRFKDKTDALARRIIFLEFPHCYQAEGTEKPNIKNDYLCRSEVLEYLMKYILMDMPNYYDIVIPKACEYSLEEFKRNNNFVLEFAQEIIPEITWDIMPISTGLYPLYKAYCKTFNPNGKIEKLSTFIDEICEIVNHYFPNEWKYYEGAHPTNNKLSVPEPLFDEFYLAQPYNATCVRKSLVRITSSTPTASSNDDSAD